MKVVGYRTPGPVDVLQDFEREPQLPTGRDVRVAVRAVSVNPADAKARSRMPPPDGEWMVLGFDASGVVESVGDEVQTLRPGDEVDYAGAMTRPGSNSELHLVDERIVGRKPARLSHAEAAALPLTTLTAWEMLFDRLHVQRPTADGDGVILIIGGAGGVGSIAIQLLRARTELTVVASASRPETEAWVRTLGAHHVVNHREPLGPQLDALELGAPGFVFSTNQTARHLEAIAEFIAPQGRFGMIDELPSLETGPFVMKSVSLHFELMFTRSLYQTSDLAEQGGLLDQVATLVERGTIRSTMAEVVGPIDAAHLREAHRRIETGSARGKLVLEGF